MSSSFPSPSSNPYLLPLNLPPSSQSHSLTPIAQVQQVLAKAKGEEWIWGQEDVGLYQGSNKLPDHQILSVQLTTHRLLFLITPPSSSSSLNSSQQPSNKTLNTQVHLHSIRQTEFYTGFMRSSPKVSLFLGTAWDRDSNSAGFTLLAPNPATSPSSSALNSTSYLPQQPQQPSPSESETWLCPICSFTNPLSSIKCSLCGVLKTKSNGATKMTNASTSSSLPGIRSGMPVPGLMTKGNGLGGGSVGGGSGSLGRSRAGDRPSSLHSNSNGLDLEGSASASGSGTSTPTNTPSVKPDTGMNGNKKEIPCPRCTFLNHPSLPRCEICSAPLSSSTTSLPSSNSSLTSPSTTNDRQLHLLKISFRKGGGPEFYKRLKVVLERKAWEAEGGGRVGGRSGGGVSVGGGYGLTFGNVNGVSWSGEEGSKRAIGIDRILQDMDLENKNKEDNVQDAFKDLEALMVRAGDMVRLVQSLSAKLDQSSSPSSTSPDTETPESTFIRSTLVQLGLPVPALTSDMVKSEEEYHLGLARELGMFLTGGDGGSRSGGEGKGKREAGLMYGGGESRGLVGLDEVWGLWNRARGVSLVPPKTLKSVLPLLPSQTRPTISVMTFESGLSVLHTPTYSAEAFANRLLRRLEPDPTPADEDKSVVEKGLTAVDIALQEGIAVGLAKELVEKIEAESAMIVRDEQSADGGGEKWQRNLISSWIWQEVDLA